MGRVVASIEARMGASRLPGKVLMPIAGVPALARMIRRVKGSRRLDGIVVATTDRIGDDPVAALAEAEGVAVFRGSEDDVLDRVLRAQQAMAADTVVELCGDCPLIDPAVIDRAVARYETGDVDLVTTTRPQSYPQGMDVEVFALAALAKMAATIPDPAVREHVSLQFYRDARYRVVNLDAPPVERAPRTRLLLDYPADLTALDAIWRAVAAEYGEAFTVAHILALLRARPDLAAINAMHAEAV